MTPPSEMPSVLVAMSGGVDSSVAAAVLHEQGYRVLGSHLKLVHMDGVDHGCCGPQAEADAQTVADIAGFDFEIVDLSGVFEETVLSDFYEEHRAGRTPNPCVRCNEHIKFRAFLDRADLLGFDFVPTGHYVRRWHLGRGLDPSKDQSYVLHMLGQEQLGRALFPVGEWSKADTRTHAARLGLPVAGKPDSQEVCFVPGADHGAFLASQAPDLVRRGGEVVDAGGRVLAEHDGTFRFTIGQRRGLGVSTGARTYVIDLDPAANRVVVGPNLRVGAPHTEQFGSPLGSSNATPPAPDIEIPAFRAAGEDPGSWIKPADKPLAFRTVGQKTDVTLVPLNSMFDKRYSVYWQVS